VHRTILPLGSLAIEISSKRRLPGQKLGCGMPCEFDAALALHQEQVSAVKRQNIAEEIRGQE
jgi:hypothetical protein